VALNWVLSEEHLDTETELALGFLDYLLLGTSAAPLRKALNDSGLGAALIGGGMDDELKQPTFCVGLKVGARGWCVLGAGRGEALAGHHVAEEGVGATSGSWCVWGCRRSKEGDTCTSLGATHWGDCAVSPPSATLS
jgi:hypothetical protein